MKHFEGDLRAPEGARFAIIASRWNPRITDALVAAARQAFVANGVDEAAVDVVRVPGAWELPVAARELAVGGKHAAIVALGCVVRGDTIHFEIVSMESSRALMDLSVARSLPLGNGIISVNTTEQAWERARADRLNKGGDAARAALTMMRIKKRLAKPL